MASPQQTSDFLATDSLDFSPSTRSSTPPPSYSCNQYRTDNSSTGTVRTIRICRRRPTGKFNSHGDMKGGRIIKERDDVLTISDDMTWEAFQSWLVETILRLFHVDLNNGAYYGVVWVTTDRPDRQIAFRKKVAKRLDGEVEAVFISDGPDSLKTMKRGSKGFWQALRGKA